MAKEVFQLEVQVQTAPALSGLQSLNKELDSTKKRVDDINKTGLTGVRSSVDGLTNSFKSLGAVLSGLALGKVATDAVTTIAKFDSLRTVLQTVTGSAAAANQALTLITTVSKSTSFGVDKIGESFIKLKAAGIEPTVARLKLFSDVASVTTDSVGALQAITDLYARTTAGGLGLEEINRLADRGIPVFDILSKRLGITRLQISDLGKTAEGAQIILRQLEQGLQQQFGGASAKNLETLNGQFSTLKKNLENLFVGVGESGATSGLKDLLKVLNEIVVSSDGTAKSVGSVLGDALKLLAQAISNVAAGFKFLSDNLGLTLSILGLLAGGATAIAAGITGLFRALGLARTATVAAAEAVPGLGNAFTKLLPFLSRVVDKLIDFATSFKGIVAGALALTGLVGSGVNNKPTDPANQSGRYNFPDTAGAGRGNQGTQEQLDTQKADQAKVNAFIEDRVKLLNNVLAGIRKESELVGKSRQEAEIVTKQLEVQEQIRQKLVAAGVSEAEAAQRSRLSIEESSKIRAEVAEKYARQTQFQYQELVKNTNTEISLLKLSNNEREIANKLTEIRVQLGLSELEFAKDRARFEAEIRRSQEARINDSLTKNLEGINKETEYLKLGNREREVRIALDKAAADAGFKNAEELIQKQPIRAAEIRSATSNRVLTGIDVAGQKEIANLEEQVRLNSILDEQERQRAKNQLDIYKAIDPEGKGDNITRAQKDQINGLLATIEAQQKLLEVNKKINEGFSSLGNAVSNWVLGSKDGIRQVRLELLKLAALQAYKYFAGGDSGGLVGSFINGVIGGISGARADGGSIDAGKRYLVGERGPEIVQFNQPGYVVPNYKIGASGSRTTSMTLAPNLIIQGSVTGQSELDRAFDQFARAMATETQQLIIQQTGSGGILRAR